MFLYLSVFMSFIKNIFLGEKMFNYGYYEFTVLSLKKKFKWLTTEKSK